MRDDLDNAGATQSTREKKEVRFTRNGQAIPFLLAGVVISLAGSGPHLEVWRVAWVAGRFTLPCHPIWFLFLPLGLLLFWFGGQLLRRPYLIFTPLGLEIYPFFRPRENMQPVFWSEIAKLSVDPGHRTLIVEFAGMDRQIHAALAPLRRASREILAATVEAAERRRIGATQ